jgi:hypothetical protein
VETIVIGAKFFAGTIEFCLQASDYWTNSSQKIDHEICCLFSDEKNDGVGQAGGNGLRGI